MLFFVLPTQADVQNKAIHIYQDSDLSRHIESSLAIQQGIKVAFDEIGNQIDGYDIIYKYLDHRGNVVRSKRNYNVFLDDPNALVIYSGIHSPPLIKNRVFINENKALTLVPWAAGGSITRYPAEENWIFRLSIDDTQAASEIIRFAIKDKACKAPHLLLEDTPWGDSSLLSMSEALKEYDIYIPGVTRFGWNLKSKGAHTLLNKIISKGNDCIVLVSNSIEGAVIVREVFNFPLNERLPIISHWGITGGDFHEKITAKMREKLDLHFIQSCFAFTNPNQSEFSNNVFSRLKKFSGGTIAKPTDLKSAAGFIHAYDLTKLLIQSIKQVGLTGNMLRDRDAIRLALEDIQNPVHGLIKTYNKPFSVFDEKTNNDAHEALHQENYCMGKYGVEGEILISQDKP
jgi:branched-chain amino acid transport system substrate-binding protein